MNKNNIILTATQYLLLIVAGASSIATKNWTSLSWNICAMLLLFIIKMQQQELQKNKHSPSFSLLVATIREKNLAIISAKYYLKRIAQLKAENEQLKILNRNLLNHSRNKYHGRYSK